MAEPVFNYFYEMVEKADNLPPFLYTVISEEKINLFLNETIPDLTPKEIDSIISYLPITLKKEIDKLTLLVMYEIDFNVVRLTTSDQVKRYLHHLSEFLRIAIDKIKYNSCSEDIGHKFLKFCDLGYLLKLKKDKNYVNSVFEPDDWKPPFLNHEFSPNEKRAYFFMMSLFQSIDFFEHEYSMVLTHVEQLQIENGFINDPYHKRNVKDKEKTMYPTTFEELFNDYANPELCLNILKDLDDPYIDADLNYIGKNKGIFPLWINLLKGHSPKPLIKHFPDWVYKDLLNSKIKGLKLSNDASEFRKIYKRLENNKTALQIKAILSQLSQSGRLVK